MRSFTKRISFFYVFAVLLGAAAMVRHADGQDGDKKESDRCFLWKVTSKTNTVYLLGSMHVAKKDLFPTAGIVAAFIFCSFLFDVRGDRR